MKLTISLLLCFFVQLSLSFAHPFKLDSYGCHNNGKLSVYECHDGKFKDKSWPNPGGQAQMLKEAAVVIPQPPVSSITGQAILSWTPNAVEDKVLGYTVYWSVDGQKWQSPIKVGNRTNIEFASILKGATYYFYITASNEFGESPPSNIVNKRID